MLLWLLWRLWLLLSTESLCSTRCHLQLPPSGGGPPPLQSSRSLYSSTLDTLTTVKKKIHTHQVIFVSPLSKQTMTARGRANSCYASQVIKEPMCGLTRFPSGFERHKCLSGLRMGNSSFQVQVVYLLMCSFGSGEVAWAWSGRCVGELTDLSTDTRSASCNWSLFHLLSYLVFWQSLDSKRQIIDLCFKDIKDM